MDGTSNSIGLFCCLDFLAARPNKEKAYVGGRTATEAASAERRVCGAAPCCGGVEGENALTRHQIATAIKDATTKGCCNIERRIVVVKSQEPVC
mmetsp:Transcript_8431/g.18935  ORF Transcript_8431/g.18935 Transcript_8431/m.18935 type:complete len:94 (-) Transcript_8431:15-296(-)